jgi:sugar phosphate isomerase/epimerase
VPPPNLPIALELYTVRDETARDFAGTLRRVAEIGYTAVEFAGYGGLTAHEQAALLRETGLQAAAVHVSYEALTRDLDHEIEYCRAIGSAYLVLPGLSDELRSADQIPLLAERMNAFGRRCGDAGVQFGYHNHNWEFEPGPDGRFIDLLLAATDPELVQIELDIYWAAYAGADPAAFLAEHSGRVPILHLKDMTPDRRFTEVGDGILGLRRLTTSAREHGVRWGIVENDAPQMPTLESARRSLENILEWG